MGLVHLLATVMWGAVLLALGAGAVETGNPWIYVGFITSLAAFFAPAIATNEPAPDSCRV